MLISLRISILLIVLHWVHTAMEVAGIGGIQPQRLQDLWATGPLQDQHRVPTARGSLALSSAERGSWAAGQ